MLRLIRHAQRDALPTRRSVLAAGTGLLGLNLPSLLASAPDQKTRAKHVIFLFLFGGPSQLETFDMKPDARCSS